MVHPTKNINNKKKYRVFGKQYNEGIHRGLDIGCAEGTEVFASFEGVVILSGYYNGYGSLNPSSVGGAIWIRHTDDGGSVFYTHYGHVKPIVQVGNIVSEGQKIAEVASFYNGNDYLPHLHFGRYNGDTIPMKNWGYGKGLDKFVDPLT